MATKKGKKQGQHKKCSDCVHIYACRVWNFGRMENTVADNCRLYETIRDTVSYCLGFCDGMEKQNLKILKDGREKDSMSEKADIQKTDIHEEIADLRKIIDSAFDLAQAYKSESERLMGEVVELLDYCRDCREMMCDDPWERQVYTELANRLLAIIKGEQQGG